MEVLWAHPELASGVLSFLAAHQVDRLDPTSDAEPGKILHEMPKGEMAVLGEVPFAHYYGSVDATLLFIILAVDLRDFFLWSKYLWICDQRFFHLSFQSFFVIGDCPSHF